MLVLGSVFLVLAIWVSGKQIKSNTLNSPWLSSGKEALLGTFNGQVFLVSLGQGPGHQMATGWAPTSYKLMDI